MTNNKRDMENSHKLEKMPTLCGCAILPAETTILKWRVTATTRQLLQLPTGGTSVKAGPSRQTDDLGQSQTAVEKYPWRGFLSVNNPVANFNASDRAAIHRNYRGV